MRRRRPTKRKTARRPAAGDLRPSREATLKAAAEIFAVKGLHGVTTEEIARAVRCSPRHLSRLFGSREALFLAAVEAEGSAVVKTVAGAWAADDPPEKKLRSCLTALVAAFSDRQELRCQLLLRGWAEAASQKRVRLAMAWIREQIRLCLEEIIEEGVVKGVFRSDLDPAALSAIALGVAEGLLIQSSIQGGAVPVERLVHALERTVSQGH